MKYDQSKPDKMGMALLYISRFQDGGVWKGCIFRRVNSCITIHAAVFPIFLLLLLS